MTEPTVTCLICGTTYIVTDTGRGFPPDVAKRKLAKICKLRGHESNPKYQAGLVIGRRIEGM